jgi:hypothetical protein
LAVCSPPPPIVFPPLSHVRARSSFADHPASTSWMSRCLSLALIPPPGHCSFSSPSSARRQPSRCADAIGHRHSILAQLIAASDSHRPCAPSKANRTTFTSRVTRDGRSHPGGPP